MEITVYPMKCPICKLKKDFISEETRAAYLRPHVLKCIDLNKRLHSSDKDSSVVDELMKHIKQGNEPVNGEVLADGTIVHEKSG